MMKTFNKFIQEINETRYVGDPIRMIAKYPGVDVNGKSFKKGEEITYYPKTKTIISGVEGDQAYRDFLSAAADEDAYMGRGGPYAN